MENLLSFFFKKAKIWKESGTKGDKKTNISALKIKNKSYESIF
jgi:hypothetical protein